MSESQPSARQMLESNLDLVRDLIRHVARRHRLRTEEAEEFSSYVWLKMVEGDHRIFRGFRGRSSLRTFLTTVVHRLFLDFRVQAWGKWRPCAEARRLGEDAVELDRWISRDGHSLESALEVLQRRRADHLARRVARVCRRDYGTAASVPGRGGGSSYPPLGSERGRADRGTGARGGAAQGDRLTGKGPAEAAGPGPACPQDAIPGRADGAQDRLGAGDR